MNDLCGYLERENGLYRFTRRVSAPELIKAATMVMDHEARQYSAAFSGPEVVTDYIKTKIGSCRREVFAAMFLNTRHQLIEFEELFLGTIDGAFVHPAEIARRALQLYAPAVIIAHNHPSGVVEPSRADIQITSKIKDALAVLDIRLLDHVIVAAGSESCSLAERGLL